MKHLTTLELTQITGGVDVGTVKSPSLLMNPGSSVGTVGGSPVGNVFGSGASPVANVGGSGGPASFGERFDAVGGSFGGSSGGGAVRDSIGGTGAFGSNL